MSSMGLMLAMFHHKSIEQMKLLKYVLIAIIAFSAASCVDETVGPVLRDDNIPVPPPPPKH